jgi:hypothetical protein
MKFLNANFCGKEVRFGVRDDNESGPHPGFGKLSPARDMLG